MWFFTDEFGKSFEKFFQIRLQDDGYAKRNFDVTGFTSGAFKDNPSVICRFANLLNTAVTTAIGKRIYPLPKIIVIVPDEDILNSLKEREAGLSKGFSRLVKFIMTEYERNIASFKENLQNKSKKEGYPHFLWISAPLHDKFINNAERIKFNIAVEDVAKIHSNVTSLELKKIWNPKDGSLVEHGKLTNNGLKSYWEAVDKTVRYCDSVILKKKFLKKLKVPNQVQVDKFRWHNPKIGSDLKKFKDYRKLPSPPKRR